ncbi:MspA family porin, partial [Mycolicibacterium goodii]
MKAISRVLIAMISALAAAVAGLFVSAGTSHAGLDNELSLVDGQDRTLTVQQWDTFLNGVFPLDRNRLTREWFHSGRAKYIVAGPGADEFEGT